jgi:hypothetical protein
MLVVTRDRITSSKMMIRVRMSYSEERGMSTVIRCYSNSLAGKLAFVGRDAYQPASITLMKMLTVTWHSISKKADQKRVFW